MSQVITHVQGTVEPDRVTEVRAEYEAALAPGLPPGLMETFLAQSEPGHIAIITVWASQGDLDTMIASGQEPLARRLIREAGGLPELTVLTVIATSRS